MKAHTVASSGTLRPGASVASTEAPLILVAIGRLEDDLRVLKGLWKWKTSILFRTATSWEIISIASYLTSYMLNLKNQVRKTNHTPAKQGQITRHTCSGPSFTDTLDIVNSLPFGPIHSGSSGWKPHSTRAPHNPVYLGPCAPLSYSHTCMS